MKNICLIITLCLPIFLQAQFYDREASRYLQEDIFGTARSLGTAGSFSAVGADFSSSTSNPAGMGLYRNGGMLLSLNGRSTTSESTFLDKQYSIDDFSFNANNGGLIIKNMFRPQYLKSKTFSFGFNRINDFHHKTYFSNENAESSISQHYVEELQGTPETDLQLGDYDFETQFGYLAWLANYNYSDSLYHPAAFDRVKQTGALEMEGGVTDLNFSWAGNYDDQVYFGVGLGIPIIRYKRTLDFNEEDIENANADFASMNVVRTLETKGSGLNARAGFIWRSDFGLRLGGSVQIPTFYNLSEEYQLDLSSDFDTIQYQFDTVSHFDYKLRQAFKLRAGASYFIQKKGFIAVEYAVVDHSKSRYDFGTFFIDQAQEINSGIEDNYQMSHQFSVGGEFAHKIFRLRAGFAQHSSPFKGNEIDEYAKQFYSLGAGIHQRGVYFDLAYVFSKEDDAFSPYTLQNGSEPIVREALEKHNITATLGWKF